MPDDTCATCGPNAVPDQGLSFARLSACEWNGCGLKPCLFGRVVKFIDVASDGNRLAKLAKHLRLLVRPLACKADKPQKDDSGAWCFWEIEADLAPGVCDIVVRATDTQGNAQPHDARRIWNSKGYVNNSWHRVKLNVAPSP